MIAVFDTNIVIDALNGLLEAETEYSQYKRVLISRITWMEVLVGAQSSDETHLRSFLETKFDVSPVDLAVAETAIQLRRNYRLRLPDALIWATAQINSPVLVSRNTRDFNPAWAGIRVPYVV